MAEQHDESESSTGPDSTEPETNETADLETEGSEAETEASSGDAAPVISKKKKKKRDLAAAAEAAPSRDRNRRLREEVAGGGRRSKRDVPTTRKLEAGEIVDDALARTTAAAGEWLKRNFNVVQWFIIVGIVGWIGYAIYGYRSARAAEQASNQLTTAIHAENAMIGTDDSKPEPRTLLVGKRPSFATDAERLKAAEKQYRAIADAGSGTAATFAKLGLASVLYDQGKYADAKTQYQAVKDSKLAGNDVAVKGRALEGLGMSLESLGNKDAAEQAFAELSKIDELGFNALGAYHQARFAFDAGNSEKAKTLLTDAQKRLDALIAPDAKKAFGAPPSYLQQAVRDLLKRVDPNAVSATPNALTADQLQALTDGMSGGDGDSKGISNEKLQELLKRIGKNPGGAPVAPAPPASAP